MTSSPAPAPPGPAERSRDAILDALRFERPAGLDATLPPEARGVARDRVRLLVSGDEGHRHTRFDALPALLRRGDLLVVNRSATLPASLAAEADFGRFRLNLSTRYAPGLWLAEPRRSASEPGELPIGAGLGAALLDAAGRPALPLRFVAPHPSVARLWFVHAAGGDVRALMRSAGRPVRYGYLAEPQPLSAYQTVFADRPGSAEMPSAGRPFTPRILDALAERGVAVARITLHTGVSGPERGLELLAEPFEVSPESASAIADARRSGGRVIAVGTTVVRALASAVDAGGAVRPAAGFTRAVVAPGRARPPVDALLTGLHVPGASHLALLAAVAGAERVRTGYAEAIRERYLWHEFGDTHLLFAPEGVPS